MECTGPTFIKGVDRFIDHWQQNAIYNEGRKIFCDRHCLAERQGQRLNGLERILLRGNASDQFDKLHHRHRVHKMHTDKPARPVRDDDNGSSGEDVLVAIIASAERCGTSVFKIYA